MPGYIKDVILSPQELSAAKEYSEKIQWQEVFQYYNLFHCLRYDINPEENLPFIDKLREYSSLETMIGSYFLKYVPGSFCRFHEDNNSKMTIVTMIHKSDDLVGGEALVATEYEQKERPAYQTCHRSEGEKKSPPYGDKIAVEVVPSIEGESLVYGNELRHGVSRVNEGQRTVLITWFK